MRHLVWNPAWEMGDTRLDRQHQAMVNGINRLADAIEQGRAQEEIGKAISFLLVYVESHFQHEEKFMREAAFPEAAEHSRKHVFCTRQIELLLETYRCGRGSTLPDLVDFFNHWIVDHLEGADCRLAAFLRDGDPRSDAQAFLEAGEVPPGYRYLPA